MVTDVVRPAVDFLVNFGYPLVLDGMRKTPTSPHRRAKVKIKIMPRSRKKKGTKTIPVPFIECLTATVES